MINLLVIVGFDVVMYKYGNEGWGLKLRLLYKKRQAWLCEIEALVMQFKLNCVKSNRNSLSQPKPNFYGNSEIFF